jgi:hypothetical protein
MFICSVHVFWQWSFIFPTGMACPFVVYSLSGMRVLSFHPLSSFSSTSTFFSKAGSCTGFRLWVGYLQRRRVEFWVPVERAPRTPQEPGFYNLSVIQFPVFRSVIQISLLILRYSIFVIQIRLFRSRCSVFVIQIQLFVQLSSPHYSDSIVQIQLPSLRYSDSIVQIQLSRFSYSHSVIPTQLSRSIYSVPIISVQLQFFGLFPVVPAHRIRPGYSVPPHFGIAPGWVLLRHCSESVVE